MKKNYILLFTFIFCAVSYTFAQNSRVQASASGKRVSLCIEGTNSAGVLSPESRAVIWSDDLSSSSNWTASHATGTTGDWVIGTTPPSGTFPIAPIASTTASNGYALFDSDLICSGNQLAYLTTTTPINCSGHPGVLLQFQQRYRRFVDSTFVEVSNDGTNWYKYLMNGGLANNAYNLGGNPGNVSLNISAYAGNQATVWVRFTFRSTTDMGSQAGCGYAWMVDDVALVDAPNNDLAVNSIFYGEYSRYPAGQERPLTLAADISNEGSLPQTNTVLTATVNSPLFSGTSNAYPSLSAGQRDTLVITTQFIPSGNATYNIGFSAASDSTDGVPANNTKSRTVIVNDSIFARDSYTYTGAGLWNGGGVEFEYGNLFEFLQPTNARSISFVLHRATDVGSTVRGKLYSIDALGNFVEIATTDYHVVVTANIPPATATANPVTVSLPLIGGPIALPDTFYMASLESPFPSPDTVAVAAGTDIVQPIQTSFIYDTPTSTWFYTTSTPMVRLNVDAVVGTNDLTIAENGITLSQNIPNPAGDNTEIQYYLSKASKVDFRLTDVTGRIVLMLNEGNKGIGKHSVIVNTGSLDAGVYFYSMTSNETTVTRKMVVKK